jgi:hypothetical protein
MWFHEGAQGRLRISTGTRSFHSGGGPWRIILRSCEVRPSLKNKARPIPENDIWIAAAAKRYGMVLVTRDHHFREVDDLQTADCAVQS